MNSKPIQQKLVIGPKKAVTKNLVIRYVLTEQASFFENVYSALCETQRILRAAATTTKLAADYFYQSSCLKISETSPCNLPAFAEERCDLAYGQDPIFCKTFEDIAVGCFQSE